MGSPDADRHLRTCESASCPRAGLCPWSRLGNSAGPPFEGADPGGGFRSNAGGLLTIVFGDLLEPDQSPVMRSVTTALSLHSWAGGHHRAGLLASSRRVAPVAGW